MDPILSGALYVVGGAVIGIAAAWAVRIVVGAGTGISWHADPWPHGVQEEEPRSDWGARFRTAASLARRSAEADAKPTIEEIPAAGSAAIPLQHVQR